MSRTVTALYDTRAEAEAARDRLSSEVDVESRAKIIDQSSMDDEDTGFHSRVLQSEDRELYGESLRRGGFMLCAEVDGDEDEQRIISLLEETGSVDMDEREQSWRNEGWTGGSSSGQTGQSSASSESGNVVEEERIPVVEEELRVGKRQVERGGARVRSYVEERPVSESVNLRQEHVNVERRPVDQPISASELGADPFQERNIEMRETSEEAVIGKEARVKEELVIQKTADQRTEQVEDTVRSTKVDVDEDGRFDRS